jgi:hypothetical protein
MRRLTYLFTFLALAGVWATAVANNSSTPPAAGQTAVSQNDDLFLNSGQALGNGASFALAIGDLDGDGHPDVFVANGGAGGEANEAWLNNGLGFFSANGQSLGNTESRDVALGDVNGNGFLDAVVADQNGITIWLNDGAGQFSDSGQLLATPGALAQSVALADLDGNGRPDIFAANVGFGGGGAPNSVWLNGVNGDPAGTFSHSGQSIGNSPSRAAALADLNGNGYVDLFFIGQGPGEVWFNNGDATFSDSLQSVSAGESHGAALADLNGNGFVDIFLAKESANEVWFNNGNALFTDSGQRLGTAISFDVSLADLNGSGALDAFVANFGVNKVWLNDGSGQFSDSGQNMGGALDFSGGVGLADLNGSGRPDAFVANSGPNEVWFNVAGAPLLNWQFQTLDVRGDTGLGLAMALDANGYPHISYVSKPTTVRGDLKYARWDGVAWRVETVDGFFVNTNVSVDGHTAITLGNDGRPHISYYDVANHSLKYAVRGNDGWHRETVANEGNPGWHSAIALTTGGFVHITYLSGNDGRLRHARKVSAGHWLYAVIGPSNTQGGRHALALDNNNRLHTSYQDSETSTLKLASWDGSAWTSVNVGDLSAAGADSSLAFDANNQPHISYYSQAGHLRYAYHDGDSWSQVLVDGGGLADVGRYTSLVLAADGTAAISYYDTRNHSLKLARGQGANFWTETVDDADSGRFSALARDDAGNFHLSYYDEHYGDLKYAVVADAWQFRTVFEGGSNVWPALALHRGVPAVSFNSTLVAPGHVYVAPWDGLAWDANPVSAVIDVDHATALQYDGHGRLHLAYNYPGQLRYGWWDGDQWQQEVVQTLAADQTMGAAITLMLSEANETPVLVYSLQQETGALIVLAGRTEAGWSYHQLELAGALAPVTVLAAGVHADGRVSLAYFDAVANALRLASRDANGWQEALVEAGVVVTHLALAVNSRHTPDGPADVVTLAYYDEASGQLRYAFREDDWVIQTVFGDETAPKGVALSHADGVWWKLRIAYLRINNGLFLVTADQPPDTDGEYALLTTITQVVPPGPQDRSQVSLRYDDRERIVYREASDSGSRIVYAFRTANVVAASAQTWIGGITIGALEKGGCVCFFDFQWCAGEAFPWGRSTLLSGAGSSHALTAGPFAAGLAGIIVGDGPVLAALTQIFQATPEGDAFVNLYAQHDFELGTLLASNPSLLWDSYRTLHNFMPGLEALVNGRGAEAIITQAMADQALDIWQRLAAAAGPSLAGEINSRLVETNNLQLYVGMTFDQWALSLGVDPPASQLYLPIILR